MLKLKKRRRKKRKKMVKMERKSQKYPNLNLSGGVKEALKKI